MQRNPRSPERIELVRLRQQDGTPVIITNARSGVTPPPMREREGAPIRVLYRVDSLAVGGSERQLAYLVTHLDRTRFEPIVWCDQLGPVAAQIRSADIAIRALPLGRSAGAGMEKVVNWLTTARPHIFHSFSNRFDCVDVLAAVAAQVPAIITMRGNIRHWDSRQTLYGWERVRNLLTDLVIANSRAVASVARKVEGIPASRIVVIRNGVPFPSEVSRCQDLRRELGLAEDVPLIGTVGNLRAVKGHDILLLAFKKVLASVPQARLVVAGANYEPETGLERLWNRLKLTRRAHFLDSRADVDRVYRALDLYVHSSHAEGMSNAVLEAMAVGLPVVATAVGGTPEAVVHRTTGMLVSPGDPSALAASIVRLLRSPAERRRLGQAGRTQVRRHFRVEQMVSAFETTYERLNGAFWCPAAHVSPRP